MGYKPPIELWCNDFMNKIVTEIQENNEMKIMAVINQHVSVDKEELIKALNYDRQQYEKGFEDGKAYLRTVGEWQERVDERWGGAKYYCPKCHEKALYDYTGNAVVPVLSAYCPHCGIRLNYIEKE